MMKSSDRIKKNSAEGLKPYIIFYYEISNESATSTARSEDDFPLCFSCWAENNEHAKEQCQSIHSEESEISIEIAFVYQGADEEDAFSNFMEMIKVKTENHQEKEEAKEKYELFMEKMESMTDEMRKIVNESMPDKGSTSETSQKIGLMLAIHEIEKLVRGTEQEDFESEDVYQTHTTFHHSFD